MSTRAVLRIEALDKHSVFLATAEKFARFERATLPEQWQDLLRKQEITEKLGARIDHEGVSLEETLAAAPLLHWTPDLSA